MKHRQAIIHSNPGTRPVQNTRRRRSSHTANYTVTLEESGTHFDTQANLAAIFFTLPAVADSDGAWFTFFNTEGQNMTIVGPADTLIVDNDAAADNIGFATATELIGGGFHVVGDGAFWHVSPWLQTEDATLSLGT